MNGLNSIMQKIAIFSNPNTVDEPLNILQKIKKSKPAKITKGIGKTLKFTGSMGVFIVPSLAVSGEGFGDTMKEYEKRTGVGNDGIVDPARG